MRFLRVITIVSAIVLILQGCSSKENIISIDRNKSYYSDYWIEDGKVYILCNLNIENNYDNNQNIKLTALFSQDQKNGLLKESILNGYSKEYNTEVFDLKPGENWVEVVFIGEYGGVNQKNDRLLPEIQIYYN